MKIARIQNLSIVAIAMEKLTRRQDGLPGIGVYYGPSGWGKTTTTVNIANELRAYYVQMRSVWTRKVVTEKLCVEMGLRPAGTIAGNVDLIVEQLAASQRPLIIDEADYAVSRPGMVEMLRDIYESSQAPLLLVGEEMMPSKLKKYERMHGRVLTWCAAQPVNSDDAGKLAAIYAPGLEIAPALLEKVVAMAYGSVRRVTVNLVNIAETAAVSGIGVVAAEHIDDSVLYRGEAPRRRLPRAGAAA